ncbi:helix-turn-helix domain-containing protein [Carboxydothermus pertinax]|uniref:Transcriptional regulator n=1 Tax=Carboxydothermus pertinax TaxID=870242 RepID=A0A1L8CSG4_9THEO|nr:helix-turn-helix domain-containing protein [Carboxydothermus pertinax]GAV21866.1 transcriptional regulator [Carboxydothermus pertinax]
MENSFKYDLDLKAIGQRIREERKKLNLSREDFAEILGLSDYYVGQLERGERQMSLSVLIKICNCLHISIEYLVSGRNLYEQPKVQENTLSYNYLPPADKFDSELVNLLHKCSSLELKLITKITKTILPYIK